MKISARQYAQILFELTNNKDKTEIEKITKKFVEFLTQNQKINLVDEIIAIFSKIYNQQNKIIDVEITSARNLNEQTLKHIKQYILDLTKAKQIETSQKKDEKILGGIIVKYEDKIIDISILNRIKNLKYKIAK